MQKLINFYVHNDENYEIMKTIAQLNLVHRRPKTREQSIIDDVLKLDDYIVVCISPKRTQTRSTYAIRHC